MTINLTKLPDEAIVIVEAGAAFKLRDDLPEFWWMLTPMLDAATQPLYIVADTRGINLPFGDMVAALGAVTRSEEAKRVNSHPMLGPRRLVADSELLRMAANALKQVQYGEQQVNIYATLEDALAAVRSELSTQKTG
jgi:hypothetical protein